MDLAIREAQSMPWREVSVMEQRREFVRLATREGTNRRELCRRFGIHPDTGYKWLGGWGANEEYCGSCCAPPWGSPPCCHRSQEGWVAAPSRFDRARNPAPA